MASECKQVGENGVRVSQGSQNRKPDVPGLLCFPVGLPKCIPELMFLDMDV